MRKKIEFNTAQKKKITASIQKDLGITDPKAIKLYIETCEKTGACIPIFATSSLLHNSHLQHSDGCYIDDIESMFPGLKEENIDVVVAATLLDYKRDFVCFDIHFRGTEENPGITIGNEKALGEKTDGGLLISHIDHLSPAVAARFIAYNNKMFKKRVFPPNMPIYKFDLVHVETKAGGEPVLAICCVADTNGPLYVHNPNNRIARRNPYYFIERGDHSKKAKIMATAHRASCPQTGRAKTAGSITDLDYLRNMIKSSLKNGGKVAKEHHKLYADAIIKRMNIKRKTPSFYERISALEAQNPKKPNLIPAFSGSNKAQAHA